MPSFVRRIDAFVVALLLAGALALAVKWRIAAPLRFVGHADAAAYAEMADSLLRRGNLGVDYISFYFMKYPGLPRPEDHWPPLYSATIVPFFAAMGKTALAAKLPSMLMSCFLLPLLVYGLVRELGGSRLAAFLAGLTNILHPAFFEWSLQPMADVLYASIVAAFVLSVAKTRRSPRWWLLAGVVAGLATYAKGNGFLLFACAVLAQLLLSIGRRGIRQALLERSFLAGLGVGLLVLLPWAVRNSVLFGSPLFSTHKYAAATWDPNKLEEVGFQLYWGEKAPPTVVDRFRGDGDVVRQGLLENARLLAWWFTMDLSATWGNWGASAPLTYLTHLPAWLGLLLLRGRPQRYAVMAVLAVFVPFHWVTYFVIKRHLAPLPPLLAATGWATWSIALSAGLAWLAATSRGAVLRRPRLAGAALAAVLCGVAAGVSFASVQRTRLLAERGGTPWTEEGEDWMKLGEWMRTSLPRGTVTATRNPWELHFYSEQPAVQIPLASLERTLEVFRFYGVTHLVPDPRRPALQPLVLGKVPGLREVRRQGTLRLYRISYEQVAAGR